MKKGELRKRRAEDKVLAAWQECQVYTEKILTILELYGSTFLELGDYLTNIRDGKLYRHKYGTFEKFCELELSVGRRRAYQVIEVSAIVHALPANVQELAQNEWQFAALKPVREERRAEVLQLAYKTAEDENRDMTARDVEVVGRPFRVASKRIALQAGAAAKAAPADKQPDWMAVWLAMGRAKQQEFLHWLAQTNACASIFKKHSHPLYLASGD